MVFIFNSDYEGVKEYCERENFSPECPADHVVLMQSAVYGRMREGQCITGNYGTIGCSKDVMKYVQNSLLMLFPFQLNTHT